MPVLLPPRWESSQLGRLQPRSVGPCRCPRPLHLPTPPRPPAAPDQRARGCEREGRGRSPERAGRGAGGGWEWGMTAARTPAGRGGPARPGRAAAERAGPALQKAAAGSSGRSHPAAGARRGTWIPGPGSGDSGTARNRPLPSPPIGDEAGPSAGSPAAPRPLRLSALPAAPARADRLAGPAPGWGRGSAAEPSDGPPSGHRAAPRGLTDPRTGGGGCGPGELCTGGAGQGRRGSRGGWGRWRRGILGGWGPAGAPGQLLST